MAQNHELMEWLGLTPADLLVYLSGAAVAAMFFVHDATLDFIFAAAAVLLALGACPLGMPRDPEVSGFTNAVKRASYPAWAVIVGAAIAVHYMWFNT